MLPSSSRNTVPPPPPGPLPSPPDPEPVPDPPRRSPAWRPAHCPNAHHCPVPGSSRRGSAGAAASSPARPLRWHGTRGWAVRPCRLAWARAASASGRLAALGGGGGGSAKATSRIAGAGTRWRFTPRPRISIQTSSATSASAPNALPIRSRGVGMPAPVMPRTMRRAHCEQSP